MSLPTPSPPLLCPPETTEKMETIVTVEPTAIVMPADAPDPGIGKGSESEEDGEPLSFSSFWLLKPPFLYIFFMNPFFIAMMVSFAMVAILTLVSRIVYHDPKKDPEQEEDGKVKYTNFLIYLTGLAIIYIFLVTTVYKLWAKLVTSNPKHPRKMLSKIQSYIWGMSFLTIDFFTVISIAFEGEKFHITRHMIIWIIVVYIGITNIKIQLEDVLIKQKAQISAADPNDTKTHNIDIEPADDKKH